MRPVIPNYLLFIPGFATIEGAPKQQINISGVRTAVFASLRKGQYRAFWSNNKRRDSVGVVSIDRKSTRLNSSHVKISYAVFCLKKKNNIQQTTNSQLPLRGQCPCG